MAKAEQLGVWLGGLRVADLTRGRWPRISCRYTEEALDLWPQNSPILSCSLPLQARPLDALPFCRGLLPEGHALQTLAARAGLAVNDTFELLARYGRDVAGALVLAEKAPDEQRFDVEPYTPETLGVVIEELDEHPLGAHDDSELSLAGLQDKLLLVDLGDGTWGRPLRGRPSTHILKLDDRRRPGLVEAEALCLTLARAAGLTTIEHRIETIDGTPCLIVSRFDRRAGTGGTERVHQEDLCQALGIDPDDARGRAKYEVTGGPSFRAAAQLLDSFAASPEDQLDRLVAIATYTVLIGNADAHGKNLALMHPVPGQIELASLYDTVPTALWPKLRTDAAMSIGGQVALADVTLADIRREAATWNHPQERAEAVAKQSIEVVLAAIDDHQIPPRSAVAKFVRDRAARLTDQSQPVKLPRAKEPTGGARCHV
jgi:serine/threonine-protein kinase HipA